MIDFLLLVSRQGKVRLAKWYVTISAAEKKKIVRSVCQAALGRSARHSNILELNGRKYISRRYASLYFIACITPGENELIVMDAVHLFVEVLDQYFGNVCELDLVFNFHRAYLILDEVFLGGELEEANKRHVLKYIHLHDTVAEQSEERGIGTAIANQLFLTGKR